MQQHLKFSFQVLTEFTQLTHKLLKSYVHHKTLTSAAIVMSTIMMRKYHLQQMGYKTLMN